MRIVLLSDRIPPENRGGAGRVAWALARGLRDAGHEVHVIAATPGAPFEQVREGIATYHLHSRYPARLRAYLSLVNPQTAGALRRLYERLGPDMVNAHNVHNDLSYYSLTLAHRMGIAAVFNAHDLMPVAYGRLRHFVDPARCGVDSPDDYRLPPLYNLREMRLRYNPLRNRAIRYILTNHASARIAVSQAHRAALEANGLPPFRVIYNGLDPQTLASPDTVERLRAGLNLAGRRVILFAGRLTRDKGSLQLLQALNLVAARVPDVTLLVLSDRDFRGEGVDHPEFADVLATHVRLGGWMDGEELTAAFHLADVVAAPSVVMDCFPTVNLEAMAARKPLVATCYGGSPEAVIDGETGFIVNPFDTAAFAERLARLLLDSDLRRRMGEAGYARLVEHFTLAEQVRRMTEVYQEAQRA